MRARSAAYAAVVIVSGLLLAACSRLPPIRPQSQSQAIPSQSPAPAGHAAPNTQTTTNPPHPKASGQSLEGRFSYATMKDYIDAILPMIRQYLSNTWPRMPIPQVIYVPKGAQGREACKDSSGRASTYTSTSYEYCGANDLVYVGQDSVFMFYDQTGDAGPAVGLAHEFGHHIQDQLGVPDPTTAAESTRHEDQADCIAGGWTRFTDQQGWLEYPDDIQDIDSLFPLIGSAEGPGRDHGTASERRAAFEKGFAGGAKACNSFYPSTPLL